MPFWRGSIITPRIDREILEAHSEGLICLSGCLAGEFNQSILKNRPEDATKLAKFFHKLFPNDFYIELQNNGIDLQDACTPVAVEIANKLGIPTVATSDAHYLCAEDAEAHDVLFCINTRRKRDPRKKQYPEGNIPNPYYVRSPQDMYNLFPGHADAVARSHEIASKVDIDIDFKKRHFPVFTQPAHQTPDEYLHELCEQGVRERYADKATPEVQARLDHELGIIFKMGFSSYFLIVWDFVRFAREEGIPCSARGSGCGSLVSYALYLSHVDPLDYDLLFERFLDPNRSEAPDIDIDFCQDRRERVIQYVKQKYGANSVAQIGTFGTLAAKAALKDVGRVLDVPLEKVNFMCKLVPMKGTISLTLDDALKMSPDFRREYDTNPDSRQWVDIARKLEGMNRGVGTHAAGVVIANGPITDYVPVQRATRRDENVDGAGEAVVTTQWEMGIIEKIGLLKMDFLGLRTLTLLDNALKMIQRTQGVEIDVLKLPLDDTPTYELLQRGDAKGVFQFESDGIRDLLKRMKPDNIRDIVACTALYRPGPLEGGMVDEYIECKHGRKQPDYPHPMVEEVLSETFGVMCIHEDALVAMADGSEKPIRDVRRLDLVQSLNLETRRFEIKECHGAGPTRRGDGLRLTLENGFAVTLTPDHKVWTWAGWREVQQLNPQHDIVAVGLTLTPDAPSVGELASWLGADEDVAYLLGQLTGDSCLTGSSAVIATGTAAAHEKLLAWLDKRFPSLELTPYCHQRSWYIGLSHSELLGDSTRGNRKTRFHDLLERHNLNYKATSKRVPDAIFRCPAPVRAAYLAGIFDSDGCLAMSDRGLALASVTSESPGLLQDLRRLCQLIGVPVTLCAKRLQIWGTAGLRDCTAPYLVVKTFPAQCQTGKTVGGVPRTELFAAVPAGESLRAFAERTGIQRRGMSHTHPFIKSNTAGKAGIDLGDVRYYRITSIEVVPDQQFYGMSVADHHNLVANGVVVKNCYQEQVMRMLNRMGGIELPSAYACIKAISKKKYDIIDARQKDFVSGAVERGMSKEKATEIFEQIVKFGGYGFNKCVVAGTVVSDAVTGERSTVGELFRGRRPFMVHALNTAGQLAPQRVTDVVWNGVKPVFRLITQLGHTLTATANHPIRTLDGWTNLGDLTPGDRVAAARRLTVSGGETWPRYELIALAGLLAEGNTCHPSTLYFYGNERRLVDDFAVAIGQFPNTVARLVARPDGKRLEVHANTGADRKIQSGPRVAVAAPPRSGAYRWAESLGILNLKATQKRVPAVIFGLCDADLELFLGRLWAGDGFIANAHLKVPYYATSSKQFASDVQCILLRLGMVSRVDEKRFRYRGDVKIGYTVRLLGEGVVEAFLERVAPYCLGREKAVERLDEYVSASGRGQSSKDTVPAEVRAWVDAERRAVGKTWGQVEAESGVCTKEFIGTGSFEKSGFRRGTVARLARYFNSAQLAAVADADIFWDRVVSIEPAGVEDTYDLTVAEDHNFVADGLIVHNSHSAAYAHITYHTAYLKNYYPAEFMAALLSSEIDDGNKRDMLVDHIADARKLGVDVLPPDVNKGQSDFDVVGGKIVFGLTAIKGLGRGAAEEIVRARSAGGPFRDLFDFCERIDLRLVTRAAIEKLIKAGAMDCFGRDKRAACVFALPRAAQAAEDKAVYSRRGQRSFMDMFEDGGDDGEQAPLAGSRFGEGLPDLPEWPELEKLKFEKESLDFYISSHPLAQFDEQLRRFRSHGTAELGKLDVRTEVRIGGMVTSFDTRVTKAGRNPGSRFALFRVEDFTGSVKCVLWSDQFARFKDDVDEDRIVLVEGHVEWREGTSEPDLIVSKILSLEQARKDLTRGMVLRMPYGDNPEALMKLEGVASVLKRFRGRCPVYLTVRDAAGKGAQFKLNESFWVDATALKVDELELLLGPGSVLFTSRG